MCKYIMSHIASDKKQVRKKEGRCINYAAIQKGINTYKDLEKKIRHYL
ncbi:hypothetical protein bcere0013_22930 [Bacillus cereus BDRD-ST26]|nr:hypothetical protein bcere0013_22930 [Bacillus cereus BDRD-ST26]